MIKGLLNWWRRREREAMRAVVAQGFWHHACDEELSAVSEWRKHPHARRDDLRVPDERGTP